MTTIVYDAKCNVIAVDGLTTADDIVVSTESKKWVELNDSIWFLCGSVSEFDAFINCVANNKKSDIEINCNALFVTSGKVFIAGMENNEPWKHQLSCSRSIGTGFKFALSALDFGKSAKESIEHAATRDIYTGGLIRVYDVSSGEFIE